MQYSPHQLKEKLLEGIDNENNVVDMPKVSEVIRLLEKYPISREILEETRIGRLVNDIRRKTTDKQLGKRAKELVRSWQKVVNGAPESPATTVNGDGVSGTGTMGRPQDVNKYSTRSPAASLGKSPSLSSVNKLITSSSVKSSLSPGQPLSKSLPIATSKLSKRSLTSPQLNPSSAKRSCISPNGNSQPGTPDSVSSQSSRTSSSFYLSDRPHTPSTSQLSISTPTSDGHVLKRNRSSEALPSKSSNAFDLRASQSESCLSSKDKLDTGQNGIVNTKTDFNGGDTSTHSIETKGLKTTIRFNKTPKTPVQVNGSMATPKKRGRGRPPKVKPPIESPTEKISPPAPPPGSNKKLSERKNVNLGVRTDIDTPTKSDKFVSLTPKVKSTAELMQTLQAKSNFSVGRDTARKIQSNMIQKEMDDEFQSVVPDGAKPRHHRKKGAKGELLPPSTPVSLKTKTEMVHKFLETSVDQSSPDDLSPLKYEMPRTESPGNASSSFDDSVEGNHDVARKRLAAGGETTGDQTHAQTVITKTEPTQETGKHSSSMSLEEIYSKYPVLDLENIVIHDGTYDMPEPIDITEEDIGRLHSENWDGVNGCFDSGGSWRDWTQTLSFQSVNDDHLHILPYVNIDD